MVSHARWGGGWRLGHSDVILGELSGTVEHRLGDGDDNPSAPRRIIEGAASVWIPATRRMAWFASATGQWAGGRSNPDRTLVGAGVAFAW